MKKAAKILFTGFSWRCWCLFRCRASRNITVEGSLLFCTLEQIIILNLFCSLNLETSLDVWQVL